MANPKVITLPFLYKNDLQKEFELGSVFTEQGVEAMCQEYTLQRIQSSFDIQSTVTNAFKKPLPDTLPDEYEREYVLSYMVSRMVLSEVDNPFLSYLFTVQEARKGLYYVENSPVINRSEVVRKLGISSSLSEIPEFTELHSVSSEETEVVTLYWEFINRIFEGLFTPVPDQIQENLEELVEKVKIQTPRRYNLTSRGLTQSFKDDPIDLTLSYAPQSIQSLAEDLQSNKVVFNEELKVIPYLLFDLGYTPQQIRDWFGWESKATESYGINWLYDLQGEKDQNSPLYLQSYSSLRDLTIEEETTYSPSVYTVLNLNDDLYPVTVST